MSRRLPVFYNPDEAKALVSAAPTRRDRLIILIGLLAGLRVSEICKLKVQDLDWANRQLFVDQGKGGKDRLVPLAEKLIDPLKQWIGAKKVGWVFPSKSRDKKPICTRTVQIMMNKAGKKAGLLKRCHPHALRHSCLSRMIHRGADLVTVRDVAGHSNVAVTSRYLHSDTSRLRSAVNRL
jgi:integrase/recombinase XerD